MRSAIPRPLPPALLKLLMSALGPQRMLTDPADCMVYGGDNSRRIAMPQAVVFAQSHEDVTAVVAACHEHGVPLVARGRGTNTTGATVPVAGGVVLSLERMNRILRVSAGDRFLVVEAGVLNSEVQAEAAKHGLFWAPDPTSAEYSTVGGNLGCSAGGPRAVKYGTARDNVLGLRAVTGDGRTLRTGCMTSKGVVGYDLTRLLIGSEGTLAVITEATLRLLPKPPLTLTLRACYRDTLGAARAVTRIMGQPETPCALEFMDGEAVRLAEAYRPTGIPPGTAALLLVEVDGSEETVGHVQRAVSAAAAGEGLLELKQAANAVEAQVLWACRKALSPSLRSIAPKKVNEDVAVPVTRLPELISGIAELSRQYGLPIVNFGHAGNGNLHVNILAGADELQLQKNLEPAGPRPGAVSPADRSEAALMQRIEPCLQALFRLVLTLEGTISGEHGVGIDKRDYVSWEIPAESLAQMRAIKRSFDPRGILNPGKTLPDADLMEAPDRG